MQTHADHGPMSKARIALIALGYALALTGALSLFRWLPFAVAVGIEVVGLLVVTLSSYSDPRLVPLFRWRHVVIWLVGALVILSGVLSFGEENVHVGISNCGCCCWRCSSTSAGSPIAGNMAILITTSDFPGDGGVRIMNPPPLIWQSVIRNGTSCLPTLPGLRLRHGVPPDNPRADAGSFWKIVV
jgi:hypothetical protein